MWQALLAPITEGLKTMGINWLETRRIKAEGKIKVTQAKIESAVRFEERKSEMDLASIGDMVFSWKDEFLTILLCFPVVLCFIPDFTFFGHLVQPSTVALNGFKILEQTPGWYHWALTGLIAAVFGLRTWSGYHNRGSVNANEK